MSLSLGVMAPYADGVITSGPVLAEFGALVEELGVESVWAVEHVLEAEEYERLYPYSESGEMPRRYVPMADPLEILSFLAASTTRLRLGTSVMVAPLHSPVMLAKRASTLDRLSGGRLLLGLGIGWQKEEYSAIGVPYADRGARLEEAIEAMSALWAEHPATYHGRFVQFDRVHSLPAPMDGRVPIVLGGNSAPAVRRCARLADGWFPHAIPPDEFARGVELLRASARDAGRAEDDLTISVSPGMADPARETDVDFVRRYVEHGASRLVITSGMSGPDDLPRVRDRVLRYQELVMDKVRR
jgi:probable F420-dependent oxidoreductase